MEKKCTNLKFGDIIGVDYGYYQHFGIYIGDYEVIHYYPLEGSLSRDGSAVVHISSYDTFLENEEVCYVCDFSEFYHPAGQIYDVNAQSKSLHKLIAPKLNLSEDFEKDNSILTSFQMGKYKVYSPQETVKRAYDRLGEKSCDFTRCNYEHYVIWCKTGITETYPANTMLKLLKSKWVSISLQAISNT
ncbi:MAG: lecithin retinol acyltransferase family protein [bacterium]|nr:lecithin retinol acyltransferase family protein [bacterium]